MQPFPEHDHSYINKYIVLYGFIVYYFALNYRLLINTYVYKRVSTYSSDTQAVNDD